MYEKYLEICEEIALTPVTRSLWETPENRDEISVVEVRDANANATWGAIHPRNHWGCRDCLQSAAHLIHAMYDGFEKQTYDAETAKLFIEKFWALHSLPLALTNSYEPQDWSVIFPVPSCSTCRSMVDARVIAGFFDRPQSRSTEHDGRRGRTETAESFIGRNRLAVGFAAVVANPVFVDDEASVALFNAPIRTALQPENCDISGGKGMDEDHGLASFIGEALERYALTGIFSEPPFVGSYVSVSNAVDPAEQFGFPAVDSHVSITRYEPSLEIEWIWASDSQSRSRAIPANLVMCPYRPLDPRAAIIASSSTNGAAGGANSRDAYVHSLLEIVERDAFWYYVRTGRAARAVTPAEIPQWVSDEIAARSSSFWVQELVNPFGVPVVQVTMRAPSDQGGTQTARGTGATLSLASSIERAFTECLQMYHSLSSGIDVNPSPTDMRAVWFSGEAIAAFPNFFDSDTAFEGQSPAPATTIESVEAAAAEQGLQIYSIPLATSSTFHVTKTIMTNISIVDSTYFSRNRRLEQFASCIGHPVDIPVTYTASTFM